MKKIIVIVFCLLIGFLVYHKNDEIIIPSEAIRMRIIANSNSIEDLYKKKRIKDELEEELYQYINSSKNIEDARKSIISNLDEINALVSNKTKDFNVNYGMNHFPRKVYRGVIYEEGEYESLVITLGNGLGENWWCVLYPPLCMINDNSMTSDVTYRSFVMDALKN